MIYNPGMAKRKFELIEQERTKLFQAYELCKGAPIRTAYQAVKLYGKCYPSLMQFYRGITRLMFLNGHTHLFPNGDSSSKL
jgi:hypothetical protein